MRTKILLLLVGSVLALGFGGGARAAEDLTAMTNADRASLGLGSVAPAADLQAFAQRRAEEMARAGRLWHTPDLGSQISGWQRLGENVGRGPNLTDIHQSFMASPSHRENIVLPQFTQIGVGVVSDGGQYLYTAVVFRHPTGAAAAPAPAPRPTAGTTQTQTKPKPAPRPAPKPAPTTTTTTTVPPPPPEPAPEPVVEAVVPEPAPPVEEVVIPRRPILEEPWFLAANSWDPQMPAPVPDRALPASLAGGLVGLVGVSGAVHHRLRRRISAGVTPTRPPA